MKVKSHVQRFGHFLIDAVIGEAYGNLVIAKDRGRRLRVTHVAEDFSLVGRDAAGGEKSAVFRLGNEGTDDRYTCRVREDGMVEGGVVVFVSEKVMAASDASSTGSREGKTVRQDAEDHLRRAEDFLSIRVGGGVAEEAVDSGNGGDSRGGLF